MEQFWLNENILFLITSQVISFSPFYILSTLALSIFFIGIAGDQTLNSSVHFYVGTLEKRCDRLASQLFNWKKKDHKSKHWNICIWFLVTGCSNEWH